MKKYARSELHKTLKDNCNAREICEEIYDTIDQTGLTVVKSSNSTVMKSLRRKIEAHAKFNTYASIIIIYKNIPVLVVHKKKPEITVNEETGEINSNMTITEISYPFKDENNNTLFKVFGIHEILDALSYDDYDIRVTPASHHIRFNVL